MMTSLPFLALIITQCGCVWGYTIIDVETPKYFKEALGMDLENVCLFFRTLSISRKTQKYSD